MVLRREEEVAPELQIQVDNTVSVGTFVAVLDKSDDVNYHIAKVLDINEDATTLHYYCTKSRHLRSALWKPMYHHPHSNEIVFREPQTITRNFRKYTGAIQTKEPEDSLIILANVGMTDRMRIEALSREILRRKMYQHHVLSRTWNA